MHRRLNLRLQEPLAVAVAAAAAVEGESMSDFARFALRARVAAVVARSDERHADEDVAPSKPAIGEPERVQV